MKSLTCLKKLSPKVLDKRRALKSIGFLVSALQEGLLSTKAPESLVFVTWNIDGLDQTNLKKRTKGVCKILEQEAADIVFLQEVFDSESVCAVTASIAGDSRDILLHRVKDAQLCLPRCQAVQLLCGHTSEEREGLSGPPHC